MKSEKKITNHLAKTYKLTTKGYYGRLWMILGYAMFGVPLGVCMGAVLDNMGLMGAFMPIGMAIGLFFGSLLDKKAKQEGRQIQLAYDTDEIV